MSCKFHSKQEMSKRRFYQKVVCLLHTGWNIFKNMLPRPETKHVSCIMRPPCPKTSLLTLLAGKPIVIILTFHLLLQVISFLLITLRDPVIAFNDSDTDISLRGVQFS